MLIETQGSAQWLGELRRRYSLEFTTMNSSEEAFTVLLTRGKKDNILVGRYCKTTGKGVVFEIDKGLRV